MEYREAIRPRARCHHPTFPGEWSSLKSEIRENPERLPTRTREDPLKESSRLLKPKLFHNYLARRIDMKFDGFLPAGIE
jgi:hypothetical protein